MRVFDYSFLDNGLIPSNLIRLTANIESRKTLSITRKNKHSSLFSELESIARIQSVKSSNAIEGIVTSDERIAAIVNKDSAPLNHDEAEIAGYRDALNFVHQEYENIGFNRDDILRLHEIMLSHTDYGYGGKYKKEDNVILEIDIFGTRRVRFTPTSAAETEKAMEQLELAYMDARGNYNINPILLIPCVILDFLCIHPFRDGNGRMSRLLSLLLLYKSGYDVGKYISFEEKINERKDFYYEALNKSSMEWHTNDNSYFPFMESFLTTLNMCYKELDERFDLVSGNIISKTQRIEKTVLDSFAPISKSEICKLLPDVSPTTVEAVLAKMVKSGAVRKVGAGRGTKYIRVKSTLE